jgi:hypothetical protein
VRGGNALTFRDAGPALETFDFDFHEKVNRALICALATARFLAQFSVPIGRRPPSIDTSPRSAGPATGR